MRVMLTSFGIHTALYPQQSAPSPFHQMPPVPFHLHERSNTFMPDYDLLLLCDTLLMDESSYYTLIERPATAYAAVAKTLKMLKTDGRVELRDFVAVLRPYNSLLERMVRTDLNHLDQWVDPLRESLSLWGRFSTKALELIAQKKDRKKAPSADTPFEQANHDISSRVADADTPFGHASHDISSRVADIESRLADEQSRVADMESTLKAHIEHADWMRTAALNAVTTTLAHEALTSSRKRRLKGHRQALRTVVADYLWYVNANLILANHFEVAFHDWQDLMPFYSFKFLGIGRTQDRIQDSRRQTERLFTVPFPELAIRDQDALLRVLNDSRLAELRRLIESAVSEKVHFDQDFAKSVLHDVLHVEGAVQRWRNVVGYITMPIGLIPWVGWLAEKVVGEAASAIVAGQLRRKHRWFYMLSEIAERRAASVDDSSGL